MTEEQIYQAIHKGPSRERQEAIALLYKKCFPSIKNLISKKGDEEQAKDIFQEGMSVMYNNLLDGKFNQESKLSTYLISICKNLWLMELRKTKPKESDIMIVDIADEIETSYDGKLLSQLLSELNNSCQKILRSFYYDNKSMDEIQSEFGLGSQQAAKNKKFRCLKKLIEMIEQKGVNLEHFVK